MKMTIEATGMAEVRKTLDRVLKANSGAAYNKILRKASKPMLDEMVTNAPAADNDNVQRNVGITTSRKYTHGTGVRIGVVKNKTMNLPNFSAQALASALEYGTVERVRSTGGATGAVRPRPWLRPAYEKNIGSMISQVEAEVDKLVQEAAR
jgi:HK97 gp10 family phage protein